MEFVHPAGAAPKASRYDDFRVFYRWGWLPLLGGCLVIAGVELTLWEIGLRTLGLAETNPAQTIWYFVRALTTSSVLALFVGWYVLVTRRRFERAREELRKEQEQLAQEELRLEQAAGRAAMLRLVGHELRNPLNGLLLHARALRRALAELPSTRQPDAFEAIDVVEGEAKRVSALLDEYLSRGSALHVEMREEPVALGSVTKSVLRELRAEIEEKHIFVELDVPHDLPTIAADRAMLGVALHHVLRNAVEAVERDGTVRVAVSSSPHEVIVDVADDGPGFSDLSAARRPFYSTKPEGSGLGLTIVQDVARAHRAKVAIDNAGIDGGGHVRLRLPRRSG